MSSRRKRSTKNVKKGDFVFKGTAGSETVANFDESLGVPQEKQDIKERSWYIFVLSFLAIAKNNCDYILNKKLSSNNKILMVGILFNFKHSIEIVIKSSSRFQNKDIDKSDYGHDVKILWESFKKRNKKSNKWSAGDIKKFDEIVNKYNEIDYFHKYLKENFSICDQENTFFKYPEHSARVIIDYPKFLSQLNKEDILGIYNDIIIVEKLIKKNKAKFNKSIRV